MPAEVKKKAAEHAGLDLKALTDSSWLRDTFRDVTKASAAKQVAIGGVAGWVAGYIGIKIGKAAATAVGGSLLLIQLAHYKGYIKVNWSKVEGDLKTAKDTVSHETEKHMKPQLNAVQQFARENIFLAGGFVCGALIGLAS